MSQERRHNQRFPMHQVASIILRGGETCRAIGKNISSGGAFFVCDRQLTVDSEVEVILVLPAEVTHTESKRASCLSKVLRVNPASKKGRFGTAVAFHEYRLP
ncbi:MAG: hypothetical protein DMG69_16110 [Acidobacteria bacterium]|nr:MAG: hypothetical protein DMG69_16110 [Acidobacteriota bacterium]